MKKTESHNEKHLEEESMRRSLGNYTTQTKAFESWGFEKKQWGGGGRKRVDAGAHWGNIRGGSPYAKGKSNTRTLVMSVMVPGVGKQSRRSGVGM